MFEKYIHEAFDIFLKEDINLLFDKEIENTIEDFKNGNYSIMEIANILRNESRARKDWICSELYDTELRYSIEMAMRMLDEEMIDDFKKSIENGTYKDFLSNIDFKDKQRIGELFLWDSDGLELFTKEEKAKYRSIIIEEFEDVRKATEEFIEKRISWSPRKKVWYMVKTLIESAKYNYRQYYNISEDASESKKIRKLSKDK